jgi:hypothetical protein
MKYRRKQIARKFIKQKSDNPEKSLKMSGTLFSPNGSSKERETLLSCKFEQALDGLRKDMICFSFNILAKVKSGF